MPSEIPWELGVNDAHCHPTDAMEMLSTIPAMKAATLTIMATRTDDQSRVAEAARSHPDRIVPSFGYHPWFSHLIIDDLNEGGNTAAAAADESEEDSKQRHYSQVLTPPPDAAFIARLPSPRPLSAVLAELRSYLTAFPSALVGEIGLDRSFRLPGGSDGRLSPHRVALEHQKCVFVAQLGVAGELGRAASVHGVQCHGALFDTFREVWAGHELARERPKDRKRRRRRARDGDGGHEYLPDVGESDEESDEEEGRDEGGRGDTGRRKPFPPRICLHSFSAPLETLKQYLAPPSPTTLYPSRLFFSFSSTINARAEKGHLHKIGDTIKAVPDDCVLVESDLHTAGEDMDAALHAAVELVLQVKGWEMERGVTQLGDNWRRFVYGDAD